MAMTGRCDGGFSKMGPYLGAVLLVVLGGCTDTGVGAVQQECMADGECPDNQVCDVQTYYCVDAPVQDSDGSEGTHQRDEAPVVPERDGGEESNNDDDNRPQPGDRRDGGAQNDDCTFTDRADTFEPDEIWSFRVDDAMPYATYDGHGAEQIFEGHSLDQVMTTPAVIDLNEAENDVPSVVFTTFATTQNDDGWDQLVTGVLRAVDGSDGSHQWSVGYNELGEMPGLDEDNPALGFMPGASVAVGDIDGDGSPEIIAAVWDYSAAQGEGLQGMAAVDGDGEVLWISADVEPGDIDHWWGGPSITDLNGDGDVEIVVGPVVYDNAGNLLWDGRSNDDLDRPPGTGSNVAKYGQARVGPLSVVEDLDGSTTREVVTGRAAFAHDGSLLWEVDDGALPGGAGFEDGYPGVADFDGTGTADVVVVSAGTVRIHAGIDGQLLWGPVDIPESGRLGPPTIADMTGDGSPEIGVAGSESYIVLAVDGSDFTTGYTPGFEEAKVWQQPTQDLSSNTTGSSVFDFNGDGEASVVYNDELYVHVFDGPTGEVLFEAESPTVTALDYPVIADVNNDGAANIVVASSDFECGAMFQDCDPGGAGLRAYGDAGDNWVTTRRIWNQHSYSINHVDEDGSIPADPIPGYLDHNTFRLNELTEIKPQAAPDLHPHQPQIDVEGCEVTVDVWVQNSGAIQVGIIPIALYADDGDAQVHLGDTATLQGLAPGESELVRLQGYLPGDAQWDLVVAVDDDGGESTRNECNEHNNQKVVEQALKC